MGKKALHIMGFVFVLIFGTLLHFTYDFFGNVRIISYISSVNESTWEHLKLIYWPFVFWSLIEFAVYGKKEPDFFAAKLAAVLAGMCFIVVFFYTYTGILGFNLFLFDIFSFAAGVGISSVCSYRLMTAQIRGDISDSIKGAATLAFLAVCFIVWTQNPPDIGIFWG